MPGSPSTCVSESWLDSRDKFQARLLEKMGSEEFHYNQWSGTGGLLLFAIYQCPLAVANKRVPVVPHSCIRYLWVAMQDHAKAGQPPLCLD